MMSALSPPESVRQLLNPVMNQPFGQFVVDSRPAGQGDVFVLLKSQNVTDSIDLNLLQVTLPKSQTKRRL